MYRVEDKYRCLERDMLLLQSRVKIVTRPDAGAGAAPYRITSLYFDDYRDSCLAETEDGVGFRSKYRIRIYNNSADLIKLEVKDKTYNRIRKKTAIISREDAEKLIAGECIEDPKESADNPVTLFNLAIRQNLLRPRIVIDYNRTAYTFSPGNVRITFDRDIRASLDTGKFLDCGCAYTPMKDGDRVLEVKYDEMLPGFIARLLETGNMNQTTFSKYETGRQQLER